LNLLTYAGLLLQPEVVVLPGDLLLLSPLGPQPARRRPLLQQGPQERDSNTASSNYVLEDPLLAPHLDIMISAHLPIRLLLYCSVSLRYKYLFCDKSTCKNWC
jgi:hypothetical protein